MRLSINVKPPKITAKTIVVDELGTFPSSLSTLASKIKSEGKLLIICCDIKKLREIYNTVVENVALLQFNILIEININKLFI